MKNRIIKSIAFVAALVLSVSVLGACQNMNTGSSDEKVAAVFEGEKISLTEAMLYAYMEEFEAEYESGDFIDAYYGGAETYWTTDMGGITMEEYAKKYAIARMLQTRVLNKYAASEKITLTQEEQAAVDKLVAAFPEKYASVLDITGASEELYTRFLNENAIANKVYKQFIADIDTNLDPEAMLRKRVNGISLYASLYKPRASEEEDLEKYTNEERAAKLNEVYDKVLQDVNDGMSYDDIVEKYKDEEAVSVSSLTDFSVKAEDAAEEGAEIKEYKQLAWTMKEGEQESLKLNYNAYFLTCVSDDDPEYRKQAEEAEIQSRKDTAFAEKVDALNKKYDGFHLYEDVYADVKYKTPLYVHDHDHDHAED